MDQYRPAGEIRKTCPDGYADMLRRVSDKEFVHVRKVAEKYGLVRGLE